MIHRIFGPRNRSAERSEVRAAVTRFLVVGLISMMIVAAPVALLMRAVTLEQALNNVEQRAQRMADYTLAPFVTSPALEGDPAAARILDAVIQARVSDGSIIHIKVWSATGLIVRSDLKPLNGRTFPVPEAAQQVLATGRPTATLEPQHATVEEYGSSHSDVVEVYAATESRSGERFLVEIYYPADVVLAEQTAALVGLVPAALLALAVLQAAQLRPAVSLARRIQSFQLNRRRLLQQAIAASDLERIRIARDLHDDVIQDLAGLSYALESVEYKASPEVRPLLLQARSLLQNNVHTLRSMIAELYPADLDSIGLSQALVRLGAPLKAKGVEVSFTVPENLELEQNTSLLIYRVARECLTNIDKHAKASHVEVRLVKDQHNAILEVTDDGVGFEPDDSAVSGHIGLRLVRDTVAEAGGRVDVRSGYGEGTSVITTLPVD